MTLTAWVCKDENSNEAHIFINKPSRLKIDDNFKKRPWCLCGKWVGSKQHSSLESYIKSDNDFSDISWNDEPVEIEITIKRKDKQ